jgi:hypothetical protein
MREADRTESILRAEDAVGINGDAQCSAGKVVTKNQVVEKVCIMREFGKPNILPVVVLRKK